MKTQSHVTWFLAIAAGMALALPAALSAQAPAQSAGQINRMIPDVNLQHGARVRLAATGAKVLWGDLVTTDSEGRARILLDDGSILNVGSNSQIRVAQHDAANQRTEIQLAYGRLRASAIRLTRPGAKFEVRTPTAVAGVVGTDFDTEFTNEITSIHVYEGSVNLCNFAGQCVTIAAGFSATVRGNQAPSTASPTSPSAQMQSVQSTSVSGGTGGGAGGAAGAGGTGGGAGAATSAGVAAAVTHSAVIIATAVATVVVSAAVIPVATHTTSCGNPAAHPGRGGQTAVLPCGVGPK